MAGVVRFLGFNPLPDGDTLAERLATFRTGQGKTQEAFAVELGIDPSTLYRKRKQYGL